MDNDAQMLQRMGNALVDLQVKYRSSPLSERIALKPSTGQLIEDYANYQMQLLREGVITTDADFQEMEDIKKEIDSAAEKEALLKAVARTIAFIATKI